MAVTITFNIEEFKRSLSVYEQSQIQFAGKVALTKFGQRIKGSQGLAQRYKRIFIDPVSFTLNSTFTKQRGLELDVGIKDRIGKGNPAGKYLFPPIGVGSGQAYDTLFTQYLRNRDLINKSDYPFASRTNPLIKVNKRGNVTANTYRNTVIGLGKTKSKATFKGGNSKIDEARVIAFKNDKVIKKKDGTEKVLAKGIYRETIGRGKNKAGLRALFYFGAIPTQKKGGANKDSSMTGRLFPEIVGNFADAQLIKLWLQEVKRLAK